MLHLKGWEIKGSYKYAPCVPGATLHIRQALSNLTAYCLRPLGALRNHLSVATGVAEMVPITRVDLTGPLHHIIPHREQPGCPYCAHRASTF